MTLSTNKKKKENLSTAKIERKKHTDKRTVQTVLEGTGCFLITEPYPSTSKRFELRMRFPFGKKGKMQYVPLGVWNKDFDVLEDVIEKSNQVKRWSKTFNKNPKLFKNRHDKKIEDKTLSEVFESFMDLHKQKVKEVTWVVTQNRLNQMLEFYGKDKQLSDFKEKKRGRQLVIEMMKPIIKRGSVEQSGRCRRLLGQVFDHCIDRGWM